MSCGTNPATAVNKYKESPPEIRFLTLPQVQEQLDVLDEYKQIQTMVAMLIYAGLRREELLWLTIDDIDYDTGSYGMIRVRAKVRPIGSPSMRATDQRLRRSNESRIYCLSSARTEGCFFTSSG